jgi:hypothetical protein
MNERATIREVPRLDLSEAMENYYRQHFEDEGRGEVFARWMDGLRADLEEAARYGADSAFILHALVCTWDRRLQRQSEGNEAIQRLTPKKRALLVGALRLLRLLGEPWLQQVLGPKDHGRGRLFLFVAIELEMMLTGGVVRTPAWASGSRISGKARAPENAVTACIVCLSDELGRHPKPAAAAANLLEKAGLLRRSRGGAAGAAFVSKRAARARDKARDRLGPIGNVVWLLKTSYADLREFLLPLPDVPATDSIWGERAGVWGTTAARYRQAFVGYCRTRDLRPHVEALEHFERELSEIRQREGIRQVAQVLSNLGGSPLQAGPDCGAS